MAYGMSGINLQNARFVKSAAARDGFIRDGLPAAVFAGRSNVGKSSAINRLLNRKALARVSAEPGKTAQVNYFDIDGRIYFIDLPGYGYARVSHAERERWGRLISDFFAGPPSLMLGVLIYDIRREPTELDVSMARLYREVSCPMLVLANKCDKLRTAEIEARRAPACDILGLTDSDLWLPFSAKSGKGRDAAISRIFELTGEV